MATPPSPEGTPAPPGGTPAAASPSAAQPVSQASPVPTPEPAPVPTSAAPAPQPASQPVPTSAVPAPQPASQPAPVPASAVAAPIPPLPAAPSGPPPHAVALAAALPASRGSGTELRAVSPHTSPDVSREVRGDATSALVKGGAPRLLETAPLLAEESALATAEAALAGVNARGAPIRPKPLEIPPDAEFNGELLRRAREARGMSLAEIAERTRISKLQLDHVEADRYASLPAPVYLRGILMNFARELGLDPLRVAKSYLAVVEAKRKSN